MKKVVVKTKAAALKFNTERVAKQQAKKLEDSWICGFGLALAEVNRGHDQPSMIQEVCRTADLDIKAFKKAGLDEYDLKELRKCLPKK